MNYSFSLTGSNTPIIKEFSIANNTEVFAGNVVYLDENGLVNTVGGKILGVCAEDHSGKAELLNARANGDKIRVDITDGGVYRIPLPVLTCSENGDENTFICQSGIFDEGTKGKLVLITKDADSINTDKTGTERNIEIVSVSSDKVTFGLSSGGASCKGDRYAFMPSCAYVGSPDSCGGFSAVAGTENGSLTVIRSDKNTLTLEAVLRGKLFD